MSNNWVCNHCHDPYDKGKKPYYPQGGIAFCSDCYGNLLKEKLSPKVAQKRIKAIKKNEKQTKSTRNKRDNPNY